MAASEVDEDRYTHFTDEVERLREWNGLAQACVFVFGATEV
jgi:hypothetical protein